MTDTALITRVAPSPTGMMHIGTARTALFNWLAARASGGKFYLRMDDTDTERNQIEAEQPIFDGLAWLGLDYDGFVRQSTRSDIYKDIANKLVAAGLAFVAENGAIILKLQSDMPRMWRDKIAGEMAINDQMIDQMTDRIVLLRGGEKLGAAVYNFSSVVDDHLMGITCVIRGSDHISNTARQFAIWFALNKILEPREFPIFAHVGLIFENKKKMSKRDGSASLLDYRDKGYDPDAIFNFLLRLGFGFARDDASNTFTSREQAIKMFLTEGRMRSPPSNFDRVKLDFYDRRYKQMAYNKAKNAQAVA